MNFLLDDDALYAFLVARHQSSVDPAYMKFRTWTAARPAEDAYFVSRMTVARLYASILRMTNVPKRESTRQEVESKLAAGLGIDSLLGIDESVLKHWSSLRAGLGAATSFPSEQLIEVATAITHGYTYLTHLTPELTNMQTSVLGLHIIDPFV